VPEGKVIHQLLTNEAQHLYLFIQSTESIFPKTVLRLEDL
jgi:hypothetical protein